PGVSIIIAYSPCIAHGVDMSNNHRQQDLAVKSGHWPLLRYDPRRRLQGENPLTVDSAAPSIPFSDFARNEARFTILERLKPDASVHFMAQAGKDARTRHQEYIELSEMMLPETAITQKAQAAAEKKEEPNV
ncbi:MAG: pyruvate:ferredoxin (flavodoxin) oxidoreductase, partial [Azonexus sp.]